MRDGIEEIRVAGTEPESGLTPAANNAESLQQLIDEIGTVIKGKHDVIKLALVALLARGHLLIEDVPGIGKTSLANALARTLDLSFQRIQFTSDLLPSDVTGLSVFDQRNSEFEWKPGPIFANIVLADEINRATPKTQSALLEAMAEEQVTVEGVTHPLPKPFMVVATQNPAEHHGTYPLPESQLDRFMLRLHIGYPNPMQEKEIILDRATKDPMDTLSKVFSRNDVAAAQSNAAAVKVDESLIDYLLNIVDQTRRNPLIDLGVSPRGALSLIASAKSLAAIEGRNYCIADDIKRLVLPCFAHRIVVSSSSAQMSRRSHEANKVLKEILNTTEVPV